MNVEVKKARDLTVEERLRCRRLTFASGEMWPAVQRVGFGRPARESKVFLVRSGSTVIGWAFVFRLRAPGIWAAHFFVSPLHRRTGVGRALAKEVLRRTRGGVRVYPGHSNARFFEAVKNRRFTY